MDPCTALTDNVTHPYFQWTGVKLTLCPQRALGTCVLCLFLLSRAADRFGTGVQKFCGEK